MVAFLRPSVGLKCSISIIFLTPQPHNHVCGGGGPGNFCRNKWGPGNRCPDRKRPWCYTTDPKKEWEYCSPIPRCDFEGRYRDYVLFNVKYIEYVYNICDINSQKGLI